MFEQVKSQNDAYARIAVNIYCPLTPGEPDEPGDVIPDLNVKDETGFTLLHYAVRRNLYHTAELLFKHGASPDIENNEGETPLMLALRQRPLDAQTPVDNMIVLLLQHGAKVHAMPIIRQDVLANTCFNSAVIRNDLPFIQYVLEQKIELDINLQVPPSGYTALHHAALDNRAEIASLLLKAGANPSITNSRGYTALRCAEKMKHLNTIAVLDQGNMQASSSCETAPPPMHRFFTSTSQKKSSHGLLPWVKSMDTTKCIMLELGTLCVTLNLEKKRFSVFKGGTYESLSSLGKEDLAILKAYLNNQNIDGLIEKISTWGATASEICSLLHEGMDSFQEEKRSGPGLDS